VEIGRVAFAERWYVVFEDATGELLSVGTVLGDVPSGYTAEEINGPPGDDEVWDKVTTSFVPRDGAELVDLIDTIMGDADLPETLDVPERVGVRDVLEEHVDDAWRYG